MFWPVLDKMRRPTRKATTRPTAANLCMVGLRITSADPNAGAPQIANSSFDSYAEREASRKTRFVSPRQGRAGSGLPLRDMGYWKRLDELVEREPIEARDVLSHDMLRPPGIQRASASGSTRGRKRSWRRPWSWAK